MKTFNVVITTSYIIEAEDENDALQTAEEYLHDDIEMEHLTQTFSFSAEELEEE
mgnify:FL=1